MAHLLIYIGRTGLTNYLCVIKCNVGLTCLLAYLFAHSPFGTIKLTCWKRMVLTCLPIHFWSGKEKGGPACLRIHFPENAKSDMRVCLSTFGKDCINVITCILLKRL